MTDISAFAGLAAFGIRSPMMELQQEVDEAVACGRALGLTHDESHEVIREMNAVYRALPTSLSWAVVRERMIARSMGLPWPGGRRGGTFGPTPLSREGREGDAPWMT